MGLKPDGSAVYDDLGAVGFCNRSRRAASSSVRVLKGRCCRGDHFVGYGLPVDIFIKYSRLSYFIET